MTRWTLCAALWLVAAAALAQTNAELKDQVRQTEIAFAKSMADRNATAFASFLDAETIFMSGGRVTRGATQVAERWKAFFDGPQAPFSWAPETVEVLDSGTLAMSSGPCAIPPASAPAPSIPYGAANPTASGRSSSITAAPPATANRRNKPGDRPDVPRV